MRVNGWVDFVFDPLIGLLMESNKQLNQLENIEI